MDGIVVEGAGRTVGDSGAGSPSSADVCVSGGDCVSARVRIVDLLGDDRADGGEEARRGHLDAEEARTRHGHRRDVGMAAKRLGELLGDVMGVGSVEASRGAQGKVRMPVTGVLPSARRATAPSAGCAVRAVSAAASARTVRAVPGSPVKRTRHAIRAPNRPAQIWPARVAGR